MLTQLSAVVSATAGLDRIGITCWRRRLLKQRVSPRFGIIAPSQVATRDTVRWYLVVGFDDVSDWQTFVVSVFPRRESKHVLRGCHLSFPHRNNFLCINGQPKWLIEGWKNLSVSERFYRGRTDLRTSLVERWMTAAFEASQTKCTSREMTSTRWLV